LVLSYGPAPKKFAPDKGLNKKNPTHEKNSMYRVMIHQDKKGSGQRSATGRKKNRHSRTLEKQLPNAFPDPKPILVYTLCWTGVYCRSFVWYQCIL